MPFQLLITVILPIVLQSFLQCGILQQVIAGNVAYMADLIVDDAVLSILDGALGCILANGLLVFELYIFFQF